MIIVLGLSMALLGQLADQEKINAASMTGTNVCIH